MTPKVRWVFGLGLLVMAAGMMLLAACGDALYASSNQQQGGIDLERYERLRARVEALGEAGQPVSHLETIVADIDRWIEEGKVQEANLRITDLAAALEADLPSTSVEPAPEFHLPPAPSYAVVPQAGGVVLFEDDFSNPEALEFWQSEFLSSAPGNMAFWAQRQEALCLDTGAGAMEMTGMIAFTGGNWSEYVYSVDIFPQGNLEVGVVFHYQEGSFYRLRFRSHELSALVPFLLERVEGDTVTLLAQADGEGYQLDQWYNVQIVVAGGEISVVLDGQTILQATDGTLPGGQVGVYALSLGDVYFDNIRVSSIR